MDDQFSAYRPEKGEPVKQVNVRPRASDLAFLESLATFEGDRNVLPLILEGIGRVIESRLTDDTYMKQYQGHLRETMDHHRRRADELAALPTNPNSQD